MIILGTYWCIGDHEGGVALVLWVTYSSLPGKSATMTLVDCHMLSRHCKAEYPSLTLSCLNHDDFSRFLSMCHAQCALPVQEKCVGSTTLRVSERHFLPADMTTYDRLCQLSNTDYKLLFA